MLEVLGEDLASAPATLAMLHISEEILQDVVRPFNHPDASPSFSGQGDDVSPERVAMALDVVEDDIDGLSYVLGRTALWPTLA